MTLQIYNLHSVASSWCFIELREITKNFIRDISWKKVGCFTPQETYLLAASFFKDISVHDVRHTWLELVNAQDVSFKNTPWFRMGQWSVANSRGISHTAHINKNWSRVWRKREVYGFVHIRSKRSRLHTYYKLKILVYCVMTRCRLACRYLLPPPSSGTGRVDYPEDGDRGFSEQLVSTQQSARHHIPELDYHEGLQVYNLI